LRTPFPAPSCCTIAHTADRMRAEFTCWGVKPQEGKEPDVHFIMYDSASKVKPPPM